MLKIRLQRIGKRGQAHFRIVVVEHTKKAKGKFLELLGTHNPHQDVLQADRERIEYWMSKGAQISPTVNNLLVNHKIWDRPKMQSWKPKKKKASEKQEAQPVEPVPASPAGEPAAEQSVPASPAPEAPAPEAPATQ